MRPHPLIAISTITLVALWFLSARWQITFAPRGFTISLSGGVISAYGDGVQHRQDRQTATFASRSTTSFGLVLPTIGSEDDMSWSLIPDQRPPRRSLAWSWIVKLPLWPPSLLCASLPVIQARRRPHPGHCRCGYDLTGNISGVCPECGQEIAADDAI